ncbi:efflux RND transporter periplasmic adaptor subunit [Microbulbifer yueqingensis]|uniref:RND family efflux transporter, MFP subunit n=1 Tax=Microbulbifer yueqingensis TaxID=658219 RepID=A0A1G9ADE9_9GAMM|nr:efflux RND transporter periplasmic adaptor subunit [Microbulbifer yueqingensis]SDK25397.1 RND family efflux transporter, MFP subunit [Microbulbifer yueqingensis]
MNTAEPGRIHRCLNIMTGAALLVSALLTGCGPTGEASTGRDRPRVQPVVTETVAWQPRVVRIEAVGTSRAGKSVTLYPEVSGEVVEVTLKAGDRVKAGQTIVQLDQRDQRLAVQLARVALEDAKRLYNRYQRTRDSGAVTESAVDDARSAVERARLSLNRAEVALDHRSIEAPFDGHIGLTNLDPGARVDPSTAITTIDDRRSLLVTFQVPELFFGQIRERQGISVATWSNGDPAHEGVVLDIDSRVDPGTRTFTVRARVDNSEDRLRPGMSFRVTLDLAAGRYPVVPEVALQWGNDGAFVWALNGDSVTRVPATIVQRLPGAILVDADLPEGVAVVTEGTQRMREGMPVANMARL